MRFGTSISRIWSALAAMFGGSGTRTSFGRTRPTPVEHTVTSKHRNKTGGPNWLKMAINQQKHR